MKFKELVSVEIEKEDRTYSFILPKNCPIGEAYDAAHKFLESITSMAQEAAQRTKPVDITEEVK